MASGASDPPVDPEVVLTGEVGAAVVLALSSGEVGDEVAVPVAPSSVVEVLGSSEVEVPESSEVDGLGASQTGATTYSSLPRGPAGSRFSS